MTDIKLKPDCELAKALTDVEKAVAHLYVDVGEG